MLRPEYDFPWLHRQFKEKNEFECIWCSEKYWAGLGTDLTIEQRMMRSMKRLCELTETKG